MSFLQRGVEEIIQKAIREGAFDNLKGKGKPLNLNENPFVDKEWHLAYRLLEQQGFALPWMEKRNEIEQMILWFLRGLRALRGKKRHRRIRICKESTTKNLCLSYRRLI